MYLHKQLPKHFGCPHRPHDASHLRKHHLPIHLGGKPVGNTQQMLAIHVGNSPAHDACGLVESAIMNSIAVPDSTKLMQQMPRPIVGIKNWQLSVKVGKHFPRFCGRQS